MEDILYITI